MFILVVFYYRIIIASCVRASLPERNPKNCFPTLTVQQINTSGFKRFYPKRVFSVVPILSSCTCRCRNYLLGRGRRTRSGAGSSGADPSRLQPGRRDPKWLRRHLDMSPAPSAARQQRLRAPRGGFRFPASRNAIMQRGEKRHAISRSYEGRSRMRYLDGSLLK